MTRILPAHHADTHRPAGTLGPSDPGGSDPITVPASGGGGIDGRYCRVRMWNNGTDQTIPNSTGTGQTMLFNDVVAGFDATLYTPRYDNTPLGLNQIKVLSDGVYSILTRAYWDDNPASFVVAINGPDTDAFAQYPSTDNAVGNLTGMVAMTCRLVANTVIYTTVQQNSGVSRTLYGIGGNYLEVIRLGDAPNTDGLAGGP